MLVQDAKSDLWWCRVKVWYSSNTHLKSCRYSQGHPGAEDGDGYDGGDLHDVDRSFVNSWIECCSESKNLCDRETILPVL